MELKTLPTQEPIRKPNRHERLSKRLSNVKSDCAVITRLRFKKLVAGKIAPAIRLRTRWNCDPITRTEPAFSKPTI